MLNISPATCPRPVLPIAATERMIEQLRLIEPGRAGWRQARTPPSVTSGEIVPRGLGDVARTSIVYQKDALEPVVAPAKMPQCCNVVLGIVCFQANGLHLSAMDDQEVQDANRVVSEVDVLYLLN
jgi:hypothetical protein